MFYIVSQGPQLPTAITYSGSHFVIAFPAEIISQINCLRVHPCLRVCSGEPNYRSGQLQPTLTLHAEGEFTGSLSGGSRTILKGHIRTRGSPGELKSGDALTWRVWPRAAHTLLLRAPLLPSPALILLCLCAI